MGCPCERRTELAHHFEGTGPVDASLIVGIADTCLHKIGTYYTFFMIDEFIRTTPSQGSEPNATTTSCMS